MTLEEAMAQAEVKRSANEFAMRSCFECNASHKHLHDDDDPFLFVCIGDCGSWWYGHWNLSEERELRESTPTPTEPASPGETR